MIPAEVVEAAAVAIFQNQTGMDWESRSDVLKETVRGDARAALEAAAPYMLAEFEKRWKYDALDSINELGSDTTQFQRKTTHGDD